MIRVITCITHQHDYRVVLLAAVVCAIACGTTTLMLSRAVVSSGTTRLAWIAGAALAFGSGVWTTHFVAMLAFEAGVPVSYAPGLTALSLGVAIVVSFFGLAVLLSAPGALTLITGTALVASAVAAMHYMGMAALQVLGSVQYDVRYVIASVAVGMVFTLAAFAALRNGRRWAASLLLAPAICGLHFYRDGGGQHFPGEGSLDNRAAASASASGHRRGSGGVACPAAQPGGDDRGSAVVGLAGAGTGSLATIRRGDVRGHRVRA